MKQEEIKQCPIKATFPGGVTAAGAVLEVIHRNWQSHSVHGVTQRRRRPQESPVVMAHTLLCSYTFDLTAGVDRAEHDLQPSSAWVCKAPRPGSDILTALTATGPGLSLAAGNNNTASSGPQHQRKQSPGTGQINTSGESVWTRRHSYVLTSMLGRTCIHTETHHMTLQCSNLRWQWRRTELKHKRHWPKKACLNLHAMAIWGECENGARFWASSAPIATRRQHQARVLLPTVTRAPTALRHQVSLEDEEQTGEQLCRKQNWILKSHQYLTVSGVENTYAMMSITCWF